MSQTKPNEKKKVHASYQPSVAAEVAAEGAVYAVAEGAGALSHAVVRGASVLPPVVPGEPFQTGGGLGGGDFASDTVASASETSASWLSEALGSAGELAGSVAEGAGDIVGAVAEGAMEIVGGILSA